MDVSSQAIHLPNGPVYSIVKVQRRIFLNAALAPRIFLPSCSDWDDFFQKVQTAKNRPVIFFDDMDDRNDKDVFLEKLSVLKGAAFVVLIYRNERQIPGKARKLTMKPITPPDLCREYKS